MIFTGLKIIPFIILFSICSLFGQNSYYIDENLELKKISKNTFLYINTVNSEEFGQFNCNGMIYVKNGEGIMVDTPWDNNMSATLLDWLRDSLNIAIKMIAPTHWHDDCMGGIKEFHERGIVSISNLLTRKFAVKNNLDLPIRTFEDSLWMDFNNQKILLYYPGAAHSIDNIVCWIEEDSVLFGGCMIKSAEAQNIGNIKDADIKEWPSSIRKLKSRFPNAKTVIPGHGNIGGTNLYEHSLGIVLNEGTD